MIKEIKATAFKRIIWHCKLKDFISIVRKLGWSYRFRCENLIYNSILDKYIRPESLVKAVGQ